MGAVLALLALLGALPASAQSVERTVDEVTRALASQTRGGVFDLGHWLKPGGVKELREVADRFAAKGRRVWFVTVPADVSPQTVAEQVYLRRRMDERDLLIVFNSRQVYGKTLALKGRPEVFRQALEETRSAFRQYYARGLAEYAARLDARIDPRAAAERAPVSGDTPAAQTAPVQDAPRRRPSLMLPLLVLVAIGGLFGLARYQRVATQGRTYDARIREATNLLTEAALAADQQPGRAHDTRVSELSERLEELRRSPQREDTRAVDLLIGDARTLLVDVRKQDRTG